MTLAALPAASAALVFGRIDWAAELLYGSAVFNHLVTSWTQKTWVYLPSALSDSIIIAAISLHSLTGLLCGLTLAPIAKSFKRFDWAKIVRQKPTKAVYARDLQQAYARHPFASRSNGMLKNFNDLKMQEAAEGEFQRLQQTNALRDKEKTLWEIRLTTGAGQYDKALRIAKQNSPETSEAIQLLMARIYGLQGNRDAVLQMASKIRPRWHDSSLDLAEAYTALGDYETALAYYERASRMGKNYRILSGMAAALLALKQYKDAAALYREAIRVTLYLATDDLNHLARCCRESGREGAAQEAERLAAREA